MKWVHISDTIADNDTTVQRLQLQYTLLTDVVWFESDTVEFLASEFGNSLHTAYLALKYMQDHDNDAKEGKIFDTICVNNASRAKHKDSWNAKWSWCLRAKIQLSEQWHIRDVVWVDDDVFAVMQAHILDIKLIQWITLWSKKVEDISQGSQFRSLEYRPTAQVIIHKYKNNLTELSKHIHTLPYSIKETTQNSKKLNFTKITEKRKKLQHKYTSQEAKQIQKTQLVWQFDKFYLDRWIKKTTNMLSYRKKLIETCGWGLYEKIKTNLWPNKIKVIDKDKFGNVKCMTWNNNGIQDILKNVGKNIWDEIKLSRKSQSWQIMRDTAYIVASLSDKTGKQCLRNWSSRWFWWDICVELNISMDETYTKRENLESLSIGSVIEIDI